jgi:hypothetical protein
MQVSWNFENIYILKYNVWLLFLGFQLSNYTLFKDAINHCLIVTLRLMKLSKTCLDSSLFNEEFLHGFLYDQYTLRLDPVLLRIEKCLHQVM